MPFILAGFRWVILSWLEMPLMVVVFTPCGGLSALSVPSLSDIVVSSEESMIAMMIWKLGRQQGQDQGVKREVYRANIMMPASYNIYEVKLKGEL